MDGRAIKMGFKIIVDDDVSPDEILFVQDGVLTGKIVGIKCPWWRRLWWRLRQRRGFLSITKGLALLGYEKGGVIRLVGEWWRGR